MYKELRAWTRSLSSSRANSTDGKRELVARVRIIGGEGGATGSAPREGRTQLRAG